MQINREKTWKHLSCVEKRTLLLCIITEKATEPDKSVQKVESLKKIVKPP